MALFQSTLDNPNLRRFFLGQGISNIGNLLKQVAIAWMAYKLTDSARLLAIVLFSREIAAFLISPFAGVIADRLDKLRLILLANVALMGTTTLLGLVVIWGWADIYFLISIQLLFGLISGTEIPTRQAFVNELVEKKENLTNAIALNSTLFNTARIVGPSVAGILIPLVGEGVCFLIYGGMLAVLLIIFWRIRYQKPEDPPRRDPFRKEMKNGWNYASRSPYLRPLLLITAWVTFFGLSYEMLLPVFADRVFDGVFEANSITFGYLASAVGAGSIFGAVLLAQRKNLIGLEKILMLGVGLFGLFISLFALLDHFILALLVLFMAGSGRVLVFTANNTLIQRISEDSMRGRVLSLYIMTFMGSKTLGNLMMGFLADAWGEDMATLFGGLSCLLCIFVFHKQLKRLSVKLISIQNPPETKGKEG